MSPPKNHTEPDAKHTTVRLTPLDHEAIHEIGKFRQANGKERIRKNDVLVDALWELLKRETGKTKDDIKALMPPVKKQSEGRAKVTEIPSTRKR
jgi:hypothetical protein